MNSTTLQTIHEKLDESKAFALMKAFHAEVSKYPANHIKIKNPKREDVIKDACDLLYKYHTAFASLKHEYHNSVVLAGTSLIIPFLAREAAAFSHALEVFYHEIKAANEFQELQMYYKQFTLKPKQILDAVIEDAKLYAQRYAFDLDVKEMIGLYNQTMDELRKKA